MNVIRTAQQFCEPGRIFAYLMPAATYLQLLYVPREKNDGTWLIGTRTPPPCFLVEYRKKPDTYVSDSWETQDRRSMNHSTLCISVMLTPVLPSALKVKENASCTVRYQITAVKPVCRFLPRPRVHNPHKHHPRHVRCTSCRPYRVLVLRCSYLYYRLCLLLWHGLLP